MPFYCHSSWCTALLNLLCHRSILNLSSIMRFDCRHRFKYRVVFILCAVASAVRSFCVMVLQVFSKIKEWGKHGFRKFPCQFLFQCRCLKFWIAIVFSPFRSYFGVPLTRCLSVLWSTDIHNQISYELSWCDLESVNRESWHVIKGSAFFHVMEGKNRLNGLLRRL